MLHPRGWGLAVLLCSGGAVCHTAIFTRTEAHPTAHVYSRRPPSVGIGSFPHVWTFTPCMSKSCALGSVPRVFLSSPGPKERHSLQDSHRLTGLESLLVAILPSPLSFFGPSGVRLGSYTSPVVRHTSTHRAIRPAETRLGLGVNWHCATGWKTANGKKLPCVNQTFLGSRRGQKQVPCRRGELVHTWMPALLFAGLQREAL